MKRFLCLLLALMALTACASAADESTFVLRHGSRSEPRIAVTVDDCFDIEYVRRIFDLAQRLDIPLTFYPLGSMLKEKDAELWRAIADSSCEIGSHMYKHVNARNLTTRSIVAGARRTQEQLDRVLGYHYEIRSLRPPYGNVSDKDGSTYRIRKAWMTAGYSHVVRWDVSETDPAKFVKAVQNGSVCLFHARARDLRCLEKALPKLIEMGFEPVTVSELLGLGEKQVSVTPYVFNESDYFVNKK